MAWNAEMIKAAEPLLKGQPFSSTGAKEFDRRLQSRADPIFRSKDYVKKGKNYGRIVEVYGEIATVRWTTQEVSNVKISSLTKV